MSVIGILLPLVVNLFIKTPEFRAEVFFKLPQESETNYILAKGSTNLLAGNLRVSNVASLGTRLAEAKLSLPSSPDRGSAASRQSEVSPQSRTSAFSWFRRVRAFLEDLILLPVQLFARTELALFNDDLRLNPPPLEGGGEAGEQTYGARAERSNDSLELIPIEIVQLELVSVNTGTRPWGNEVALNIYGDLAQSFYHPSWLTQKRPTRLREPQVLPGAVGHFIFQIRAPAQAGDYQILFRPVYEDSIDFQWLGDDESIFKINVKIKEPVAELASATSSPVTENFIQPQNINFFDFFKNQSEPSSEPLPGAPSQPVKLDVSLGSASRSGAEITSDAPPQLVLPEPVLQAPSEVLPEEGEEDKEDEGGEKDEEDEEVETAALPDIEPPVIQLQELPSKAKDLNITLRWQAEDRETPSSSASGISFFDIFFQIDLGDASSTLGWTHLTQTSSTEYVFTGENKKSYKFKVQATDKAVNSSEVESEEVQILLPHIVISEIQIGRAGGATDEWIELYNPRDEEVSLAGWKLSRKTASGKTQQNLVNPFPDNAMLAPKSFYLVSHPSGYTGDIAPDTVYTTQSSVAPDNTVILYDANNEIVDLVGFGSAGQYEGTAPALALLNDGKSISRAVGEDSDENAADFTPQGTPNPQNSESDSETD